MNEIIVRIVTAIYATSSEVNLIPLLNKEGWHEMLGESLQHSCTPLLTIKEQISAATPTAKTKARNSKAKLKPIFSGTSEIKNKINNIKIILNSTHRLYNRKNKPTGEK